MKLLTRNDFRDGVFNRDDDLCVVCGKDSVDAHHILERRLWPDGGYYLDNGASVCWQCHLDCESTKISPEELRIKIGITKPVLPPHLYDDLEYDKWGNIILSNGRRLKGELFFDESVQKVIQGYLPLFNDYVKYPRTYHLPWSHMGKDDRMMAEEDVDEFDEVVIMEKVDGENTSMYTDYIHARSVDSRNHDSRNWVKNFWSGISADIPKGWRVCGENMYAKHSIKYDNLKSYFYGFSIWNEKNICLDWDATIDWFALLGITPVPILFEGLYCDIDKRVVKLDWSKHEGYVIRDAGEIPYGQFRHKVGKYVRPNHVQTVKHWMHGQQMEINELCSTS